MAVIRQFPKGGKRPPQRKRWRTSSGAPGGPKPAPRGVLGNVVLVICALILAFVVFRELLG